MHERTIDAGRPAMPVEEKPPQSTREYRASSIIEKDIKKHRVVFEREITPETKTCLIGDGQGMDTKQFLEMGVRPENIASVNYDAREIMQANASVLEGTGVSMGFADITDIESLHAAGIPDGGQEVAILMHVLETPIMRGPAEKELVNNLARILSENGEALVSQYKQKLSSKDAEAFGVEVISPDTLQAAYGEDWKNIFRNVFDVEWTDGMRYSEISRIRTAEELTVLFSQKFNVKLEETDDSYILRLQKKA